MLKKLSIAGLLLVTASLIHFYSAAPEENLAEVECPPPVIESETAQEQKAEIQQSGKVNFNSVSFSYNPKIFGEVKSEEINEEFPLEREDDKPGDNFPKHLAFRLKVKNREALIRVLPIEDYRRMYAVSADCIQAYFDTDYNGLRKILSDKNFRLKRKIENGFLEEMPFMYYYDAGQAFQQKVKLQSFKNGKGVFFLTQFTSEVEIINNEELDYIYQGITDDGKYLIVADFPAATPFLPDNYSTNEFEGYSIPYNFFHPKYIKSNQKRYEKYVTNVAKRLEKLPSDKYEPSLKYFEDLIVSLKIEK
jgi:hypothetical protein